MKAPDVVASARYEDSGGDRRWRDGGVNACDDDDVIGESNDRDREMCGSDSEAASVGGLFPLRVETELGLDDDGHFIFFSKGGNDACSMQSVNLTDNSGAILGSFVGVLALSYR